MSESVATSILASDQLRVETLQLFLLIGRLPTELAQTFFGAHGEPAELAAAACLMFAGMGLHWPLPCLARRADGNWFDVPGVGPGDGTEWQQ